MVCVIISSLALAKSLTKFKDCLGDQNLDASPFKIISHPARKSFALLTLLLMFCSVKRVTTTICSISCFVSSFI